MDPTRRTVVTAGIWAAPVVALAVAAPDASASTGPGVLTLAVSDPIQSDNQTYYVVKVTNTAGQALPGGSISATLDFSDSGSFFSGWSSDGNWTGPTITGTTYIWLYQADLAAGAQTGYYVLIVGNSRQSFEGAVSVPLTVAAPGYTSASYVLLGYPG